MTSSAYEIIVRGIARGRAARQWRCTRLALEPQDIQASVRGHRENVVEYSDISDRVLKVYVRRDIDAWISVKEIVVDRAVGHYAAILPPEMQSIVMINIGGVVPICIVVDVIVMNPET